MVFLASGQYTLSMRSYAPFQNVVRIKDMTPVKTKLGSGKQNALASHKGKPVVMNAVASIVRMILVRERWCL